MNCNCPQKSLSRSARTGLRILLGVIVCVMLVGGLAWCFRFHLLWKYAEWRFELHEVKAIPNSLMPKTEIPEDWEEHSFNGISFRLPPDMALTKSTPTLIGYRGDSNQIAIGVAYDKEDVNSILNSLSSQFFPPMSAPATLPQLRLECLGVGTDDFRWSMSPKEAQRLGYLLTMRRVLEVNYPETTESFSRDDKEGVLLIEPRRAALDWQSTTAPIGGYIHFWPLKGNDAPLELDWIRSICESITIDQTETGTASKCP